MGISGIVLTLQKTEGLIGMGVVVLCQICKCELCLFLSARQRVFLDEILAIRNSQRAMVSARSVGSEVGNLLWRPGSWRKIGISSSLVKA